MFHSKNFFKHTYCKFKFVNYDFTTVEAFKSKSGSQYHYTEEGVFRYSNHWGRVANCRWELYGVSNYKAQSWYVGYANWFDFYDLSSTELCFFLEVNLYLSKVQIEVLSKEEQELSSRLRLTLSEVLRRKKEVEQILKDDKWAKYLDLPLQEAKERMVHQLLNTRKKIQDIKRTLMSS